MAATSRRTINIILSGTPSFAGNNNYSAAANSNSPASIEIKTLAIGANTITPPTGGSTPKGVTIVPPALNATGILLKKVTGDTGIDLHLTDPTSLGLGSPTGTFVLTAAAEIVGVTFIWT